MSTTQIHLALNHIPILLSITGASILLFGLIRKNSSILNTALTLLVTAALFTVPVYLTGEGTEESVENLAGVSKTIIEEHEEIALIAFAFISATGIIALVSLIFRKSIAMSRRIATLGLIVAFISFGAFAQTAHLGGQIRHTELRNGNIQNANNAVTESQSQTERNADD